MFMEFLQINVDRRRAAHELLFQTATKEGIDLILISEPNKSMSKGKTWYKDVRTDACLINRNSNIKVSEWGCGTGFVWIKVEYLYIFSVYISPNSTDNEYELFLQNLQECMQNKGRHILIGGDFNAKSPLWGSQVEDKRGKMLAEWISSKNLITANRGEKPTFQRDASQSIIDITFTTDKTGGTISDWRVLDEETLSLHNYIRYKVQLSKRPQTRTSWKRGCFSQTKFADSISRNPLLSGGKIDVESVIEHLRKSQTDATQRVKMDSQGQEVFWWTGDIQTLRTQCLSARRRYSRGRCRGQKSVDEIETFKASYKENRRNLKKAIFKRKAECWTKLCNDLNGDIWGEGYKIVMRSLKQRLPRLDISRERRIEVAKTLFPESEVIAWIRENNEDALNDAFSMAKGGS